MIRRWVVEGEGGLCIVTDALTPEQAAREMAHHFCHDYTRQRPVMVTVTALDAEHTMFRLHDDTKYTADEVEKEIVKL